MKKMIIGIIALSTAMSVNAQEVNQKSVDEYKNIISVDAAPFILQFLNFSGNSVYSGSSFNYKRKTGNCYLRTSLSHSLQNSNDTRSDTITTDNFTSSNQLMIGLEKPVRMSDRWGIYWGGGIYGGYSSSNRHSESNSTYMSYEYHALTAGLSPFLGITFKINDRLRLSTEAKYNLGYSQGKNKNSFKEAGNSLEESDVVYRNFYSGFGAPVMLNLEILF